MRILYLHQFFATRADVGGTRSYEFARRFVARGHQVTMVTAARTPHDRPRSVDGIEVVPVHAGYANYVAATRLPYRRRMVAFARFAHAARRAALTVARPDVVYATSPPLTMALPALAAARKFRAPLVFEVRDLWPEAPIQMGALRSPPLRAAARAAERHVYRRAAALIALSPGIRDGMLAAGADPERIVVVPNASDLELFRPDRDGWEWRRRHGLRDRLVCAYIGTMGAANDLQQVLDAAEQLQKRGCEDVALVLCGGGARREALEDAARARELRNVHFVGPVPRAEAAEVAAAADVLLVIFKAVPALWTGSPNKFFDALAAGRPVIVNTPGWLAELVERHEAGIFVPPDDGPALADAIERLRSDPVLRERMGAQARALAEREFARDRLAARVLAVLEAVVQRQQTALPRER
ncbi:glycosyltransferase family 4 protein [Thermoleophilum album]|uniref:Glycosyltransferase involved in cell wall bisynthesis n=1 Tax=Thermoleophilum album TaxID=29539 RepID=A0A1H6FJE7_THEAL|nr:glycosyltransferase family 4 protein [Thermoleophilum album]SEH10971.1 Glycosyltransferase involved in cell wall bisynthesis [Thermoleophilum album]